MADEARALVRYATWALLALTAAFAVAAVDDLVAALRILPALPAPATARLDTGQRIANFEAVLFYVHLAAAGLWFALVAAFVRSRGGEPGRVLRTAPLVVWRIGAAVTLAAAVSLPHVGLLDPHRFELRLEWMVPVLVARLALAALLAVAVLGIHRRLEPRTGTATQSDRPSWPT